MKSLVVLCAFALVLTGCAGGSGTTGSTADATTTTQSGDETSTSTVETTPTTAGDTTTTTTSGRELAPDFTLELGEGGSYTLSEGARPVYLVFWAEW